MFLKNVKNSAAFAPQWLLLRRPDGASGGGAHTELMRDQSTPAAATSGRSVLFWMMSLTVPQPPRRPPRAPTPRAAA